MRVREDKFPPPFYQQQRWKIEEEIGFVRLICSGRMKKEKKNKKTFVLFWGPAWLSVIGCHRITGIISKCARFFTADELETVNTQSLKE